MTARLHTRANTALRHAAATLDALAAPLARAVDRAAIPAGRDGYPARASGAEPGSSTPTRMHTARVELDHWGRLIWTCTCGDRSPDTYDTEAAAYTAGSRHLDDTHTGRAISYSDPTGDAASRRDEPDPVARDTEAAVATLERIDRELTRLHERLTNINAHGTTPDDPTRWCTSCARYRRPDGTQHHTPVAYRPDGTLRYPTQRLCTWCGEFHAEHRTLPPVELIEKRARGMRVYQADIDAALTPPKPPRTTQNRRQPA